MRHYSGAVGIYSHISDILRLFCRFDSVRRNAIAVMSGNLSTPGENLKPLTLPEELRQWWSVHPSKVLFLSLLILWCLLFHFLGNSTYTYVDTRSLFLWLKYIVTISPDDDYCVLIPIVVVGLLIWKRDELRQIPKMIWWPGFAIVALGLVIHIAGFMVQQARVSMVGFIVGLYGLTGLVWGKAWLRATFFPMFLLGFCIPLGTLAEVITLPLRKLVTFISVGIGHGLLGIDVQQNGSQILDLQGRPLYDVAPACSGIRSLISLLALTTIYGFMTLNSIWKRMIIILTAFPLAVVGNVMRISSVIVVGELFGQKAGMLIEQKLGFLTFAVAIAGMLFMGRLLRNKNVEDGPTEASAQRWKESVA